MQLRPLNWLLKNSHHQINTTAEQEVLLRRAAQISGLKLSEFILAHACIAAELVVQDQRQFFVSGSERQQLTDLQERPASPIQALSQLLHTQAPWNATLAIQPPQALAPEHSLFQFDCGKRALNDWLTQRSRISQLKGTAKTFVVTTQQRVVGYFSLSVGQVDSRELPGRGQNYFDHSNFPVPVVMLTRLAIDKLYQRKSLGKGLLREAIGLTQRISQQAGVEALLTQPIDQAAAQFYQACGFEDSPAAYKQLILMIKDIEATQQTELATA